MNVIDIIFWGWYQILDKTIYLNQAEAEAIGPKEHSFFITFLFHGINVWTITRYFVANYFLTSIPLYLSLAIGILIFVGGYIIYFKRDRVNRIVTSKMAPTKAILSVAASIAYVVISVYCMFEVGQYVRSHAEAR